MSLVVCTRPGCGLTAATTLLVDGRRVAAVCSERCGYELIGPKRSADDASDTAATASGDEKRQDVYREMDKSRYYADLRSMVLSIRYVFGMLRTYGGTIDANQFATLARMRWILHQIINQGKYRVFNTKYWMKQANIDYDTTPPVIGDKTKQLDDMVTMANTLLDLVELARRVDELTPLAVSGTTMSIGRRMDRGGSDLKRRIDEAIAAAVATIDQIAENKPYDMNSVEVLLSKLRDDIAADEVLDIFDDTVAGKAAKQAGIPDELRLLIAMRENPLEIVGTIRMQKEITWMCVTEYGFIEYDDGSPYAQSIKIGRDPDIEKHLDAAKSRRIHENVAFGPNTTRKHEGTHIGPARGSGFVTPLNKRALILATGLYEASVFLDFPVLDGDATPGSVVCVLRKSNVPDGEELVAQYTAKFNTFVFRTNHMAIDAKGFLWCICVQADGARVLIVVDTRGNIISNTRFKIMIDCICAGVEGVWIACSNTVDNRHAIVHLRLAPEYNYSVGK